MNLEINTFSTEQQIAYLEPICQALIKAKTLSGRLDVLMSQPKVKKFLQGSVYLEDFLSDAPIERKIVAASLFVLGQTTTIFQDIEKIDHLKEKLDNLFQGLAEVDQFYDTMGGIVGYHLNVLRLILEAENHPKNNEKSNAKHYLKPPAVDLREDTPELRQAKRYGIEKMIDLGEIYPVGGAGDRLNLKHDESQEPLPAAALNFMGKSLLEDLFRDLQAREYLHYKLIGVQINAPVALMTSHEKNNQHHIEQILTKKDWFGRGRENFFFFTQPLVPVITTQGNWAMHAPLKLMLKPGGHGVIWKLALDKGLFKWFQEHGRTKALVRQINNPIAGTDDSIPAFTGLGMLHQKEFGFASCSRLLNTAEGVNILIETEKDPVFDYIITNIEYTHFQEKGILDEPCEPGSSFSMYPANTNILFVDLKSIIKTLEKNPIPGMLVNMKNSVSVLDHDGHLQKIKAGRLESTMQNIADEIVTTLDHHLTPNDNNKLKTFITFNDRNKTISVTKNSYHPDKPIVETPEGCYYDILKNNRDVLVQYCEMKSAEIGDEETYLKKGPGVIVEFHPALGPFWKIIGQKIKKGKIAAHSELKLEIAELLVENLQLEGSLLIQADQILGHPHSENKQIYSEETGKCILKNVTVKNQGIDREAKNTYWKHHIKRKEALKIHLKGNGEFYAENVVFSGNLEYKVPNGHRMVISESKGKLQSHVEPISKPTWHWQYSFDENNNVLLRLYTTHE